MTDQTPRTEAGRRLLALPLQDRADWLARVLAIEKQSIESVLDGCAEIAVSEYRRGVAQARAEGLDDLRVALDESRSQWEHAKAGEAYRTLERAVRAILEGETE